MPCQGLEWLMWYEPPAEWVGPETGRKKPPGHQCQIGANPGVFKDLCNAVPKNQTSLPCVNLPTDLA